MEDLFGYAKGGGTEQHPAGSNHMEGDQAPHKDYKPILRGMGILLAGQICERTQEGAQGVPYLIETQEDAMKTAPQDEVEGGSMPESTQEHRHKEVEVLTELAMTIASEGDV